ncbi:MAG TPA: glutathione S-transferase family protein [Rhizomicrobium sp.]
MITVYGAYNFPPPLKGIVRDFRVFWALEELGLPFDVHWMDFARGEQKLPSNRLINPFGKIPSLENGSLRMFESAAIVLYLYENVGKAPQDAHARAELHQWCFAALNTVEPVFVEIFRWDMFWQGKSGREWRYPELLGVAAERLAELETGLGAKPYFLREFGPADILMTTVLDFVRNQSGVLESSPVMRAYLERCRARPSYQRAFVRHGEGPQARAA